MVVPFDLIFFSILFSAIPYFFYMLLHVVLYVLCCVGWLKGTGGACTGACI